MTWRYAEQCTLALPLRPLRHNNRAQSQYCCPITTMTSLHFALQNYSLHFICCDFILPSGTDIMVNRLPNFNNVGTEEVSLHRHKSFHTPEPMKNL